MRLQREIRLFDGEPIVIGYVSEEFRLGDTPIFQYDKYKISILLSDGLNAVIGDRVICGRRGEIMLFRPDELHFGRISRSGEETYLDILIPTSFTDKFHIRESMAFLSDTSESRINCITLDSAHSKQLLRLATSISELMLAADEKNELRIFSLVLRIILLCGDFYEAEKMKTSESDLPAFIKKTMLYISSNFEKKISLAMLAKNANCSVAYLGRTFKAHLGMTVYGYITAIRIAHAQIMLNEGASVTEACFASGFNDCSNFILKFKRATGKTPEKFKRGG